MSRTRVIRVHPMPGQNASRFINMAIRRLGEQGGVVRLPPGDFTT
jgi:hypothetical protein